MSDQIQMEVLHAHMLTTCILFVQNRIDEAKVCARHVLGALGSLSVLESNLEFKPKFAPSQIDQLTDDDAVVMIVNRAYDCHTREKKLEFIKWMREFVSELGLIHSKNFAGVVWDLIPLGPINEWLMTQMPQLRNRYWENK